MATRLCRTVTRAGFSLSESSGVFTGARHPHTGLARGSLCGHSLSAPQAAEPSAHRMQLVSSQEGNHQGVLVPELTLPLGGGERMRVTVVRNWDYVLERSL